MAAVLVNLSERARHCGRAGRNFQILRARPMAGAGLDLEPPSHTSSTPEQTCCPSHNLHSRKWKTERQRDRDSSPAKASIEMAWENRDIRCKKILDKRKQLTRGEKRLRVAGHLLSLAVPNSESRIYLSQGCSCSPWSNTNLNRTTGLKAVT
eukprot:980073-Rhodomonas_salina.1